LSYRDTVKTKETENIEGAAQTAVSSKQAGALVSEKRTLMAAVLFWAALLAPLVICVLYMQAYAVDAPRFDDFHCMNRFRDLCDGRCNWIDVLFTQHNEHRVGSAYILLILLAPFTHYHTNINCFAGLACLLASASVVVIVAWQRFKSRNVSAIALIPITWLILSLRQTENFLLDFQILLTMSVFFHLLSLYLLDGVSKIGIRFFFAAVAAFISSFSNAGGLLTLPSGALLLIGKLAPVSNLSIAKRAGIVLSWLACCLGIISAYFWHFFFFQGQKKAFFFLLKTHPDQVCQFFLAFLGSPFAVEGYAAAAIGFVFVAALLTLMASFAKSRQALTPDLVLPAMIMSYGILSAIMITYGRAPNGEAAAYASSRYAGLANYAWIGLYIGIVQSTQLHRTVRPILIGAILACLVIGSGTIILFQREAGISWRNLELQAANIDSSYRLQGKRAINLVVKCGLDQIDSYAIPSLEFMEKRNFSIVSSDSRQTLSNQSHRLGDSTVFAVVDKVNDNYCLNNNQETKPIVTVDKAKETDLFISGWNCDMKSGKPASRVIVSVDSKYDLPTASMMGRRDIACAMNKESALFSGFEASCRLSLIPAGLHDVRVKFPSSSHPGYYESPVLLRLNVI
jgi:hypothetical protein